MRASPFKANGFAYFNKSKVFFNKYIHESKFFSFMTNNELSGFYCSTVHLTSGQFVIIGNCVRSVRFCQVFVPLTVGMGRVMDAALIFYCWIKVLPDSQLMDSMTFWKRVINICCLKVVRCIGSNPNNK